MTHEYCMEDPFPNVMCVQGRVDDFHVRGSHRDYRVKGRVGNYDESSIPKYQR